MGLDVDAPRRVGAKRARCLGAGRVRPVLTDMRLPDGEGLELVRDIAANHRSTPVAVITAFGSAENAVAALKAGAFDYLAKPVVLEQLRATGASRRCKLSDRTGKPAGAGRRQRTQLLGESPAMQACARRSRGWRAARRRWPSPASRAAARSSPRAMIHAQGARAEQPFVAGELRRDSREPDGERVLRLPQGRVHRRERRPRRLLPGRQRRHAVPRRSRRPAAARCRSSCCARSRKRACARSARRRGEPVDVRIISATHKNLAGAGRGRASSGRTSSTG